ncbi:hypothetical protein ACFWPU_08035 [Streptomyces sp. NPDC058471]|uniref:hypothetical protein n=1 Tax=Streptomyces sp. NPDC058471 TaxID=3346516 RepID=UPI003665A8D0
MTTACTRAGIPGKATSPVVEHYLDGELRGKPSHGVAKFAFESQFFSQRIGPPRIKHERGAMAVVDGRREVGPISADFAARPSEHDLAAARSRVPPPPRLRHWPPTSWPRSCARRSCPAATWTPTCNPSHASQPNGRPSSTG